MHSNLITLRNFSVTLNGSHPIISNINLEFHPGEIFGVIGPSGSGKTTLLKAIALLIDKKAINGFYNYEGRQIYPVVNERLFKETRKDLVFIHQHPVLFKGTVQYNIEYGLRLRNGKNFVKILEPLIESFQLKELLNRNVQTLSGGEKQRVCFLRAMALKPRILILDEPTQNLDPWNVKNIEKNIRDFLNDDGMVIIVTHNFFQAQRITHRTAILINGKIVEVNETEKLFESPNSQIAEDFLSGKMIF
ncbi:MAG: ATP-binding cassette domain-containing protein [Candidatus Hodarchaeales archaeon]|jgi:ABC-type phosphate transport system ATPase subunit